MIPCSTWQLIWIGTGSHEVLRHLAEDLGLNQARTGSRVWWRQMVPRPDATDSDLCWDYVSQRRNTWVKLHAVVTSAVVTSRSDDSQLPELLRWTLVHHDVCELSADKAYSTHDNHEVLDRLGIETYIAFQDHAVVNPKYPIWSRRLCEFLFNLDKFKVHYHRRSNVEATFSMIKEKFGAAVSSRLPTAQANEVLAKCIAHNLCCVVKAIFTAGLAPTFWPEAHVPTASTLTSEP